MLDINRRKYTLSKYLEAREKVKKVLGFKGVIMQSLGIPSWKRISVKSRKKFIENVDDFLLEQVEKKLDKE